MGSPHSELCMATFPSHTRITIFSLYQPDMHSKMESTAWGWASHTTEREGGVRMGKGERVHQQTWHEKRAHTHTIRASTTWCNSQMLQQDGCQKFHICVYPHSLPDSWPPSTLFSPHPLPKRENSHKGTINPAILFLSSSTPSKFQAHPQHKKPKPGKERERFFYWQLCATLAGPSCHRGSMTSVQCHPNRVNIVTTGEDIPVLRMHRHTHI